MPSTTLVRRQLGARLRKLREDVHKSRAGVASTGIVAEATLWRIEAGKTPSRQGNVRALCQLYGADDETTDALVELAKASKGDGWIEQYGDAVPETLQLFLGAEVAASKIFSYDSEVIPGALQCTDYARALFQGESPDSSPEHIDRVLAARLERQARFWSGRPNDAILCVVLNEAALAREVGGCATMRTQVQHLKELSGQRGTEVRILTWPAGAHPAIYGGYTIFEFGDEEDPPVVFVESYKGGQYTQEERDVTRMQALSTRLYDLSTPISEM